MKKTKLTALTLMLASAVVSTAFGGAILANNAAADAATYALADVFSVTDAKLGSETIGEGENANNVTALTLQNKGSVTMKRSLALKWHAEKGKTSYFTMTFAFKTLNFKSVTLEMESDSAWATKDEKTTNTVKFTNEAGTIKVSVNGGEAKAVTVAAGQKLTLSLTERSNVDGELSLTESSNVDGEFGVKLTGVDEEIGTFTNIGANYAKYSANEQYPLTIKAEAADGAEGDAANTVVLLYDINGQQFDNLTSDGKIEDNAAPVLVVNENVSGFLLGTAFDLDYTVVDVLKSTSLINTLKYYQYNPNLKDGDESFESGYKTLSTSVYFMDTVCYGYYDDDGNFVDDSAKQTTVFKEKGKELVSIKLKTSDGTNDEIYDLAWYANATETVKGSTLEYLPVDKNTDGPEYNGQFVTTKTVDEKNQTVLAEENADFFYNDLNKYKEEDIQDNAVLSFRQALENAAKDVYAGSKSYIYFPSFKWLIGDNNGYRNLKFTISYKTPSSDSASGSSNLSYNTLKLAVPSEGKYEFKIFANDKAGNTMKYYLDGELVSVTSSNVWAIEGIPSFTFEIKNHPVKVEDALSTSSRKDTEVLDKTYKLDDLSVVGANSLKENYKLFKIDRSKYNNNLVAGKQLTAADLYAVTYDDLAKYVDLTKVGEDKDYFKLYLTAYAQTLANKIGATEADVEKIKSCFGEIKEYDSRITEENTAEWEAYNKFEWSASSQSFKTVEEGSYLILADYWEAELPASQRAAGYKIVVVESKADVIKGENDWLKNNVASVVLFSIAGVMLILIIILLLIKPSDETLEDVDVAAAKAKAKEKKDKNDK